MKLPPHHQALLTQGKTIRTATPRRPGDKPPTGTTAIHGTGERIVIHQAAPAHLHDHDDRQLWEWWRQRHNQGPITANGDVFHNAPPVPIWTILATLEDQPTFLAKQAGQRYDGTPDDKLPPDAGERDEGQYVRHRHSAIEDDESPPIPWMDENSRTHRHRDLGRLERQRTRSLRTERTELEQRLGNYRQTAANLGLDVSSEVRLILKQLDRIDHQLRQQHQRAA